VAEAYLTQVRIERTVQDEDRGAGRTRDCNAQSRTGMKGILGLMRGGV
jgi:hypothetical protein